MKERDTRSVITLLDGGMGRELLRIGAPFRQPEWSALSLMKAPDLVKKVHESFAAAGSDVLTTSNYAVVPYHIGEERFYSEGAELTARAGRIAAEAASSYDCRVAGSIPPLFGSYRPDLFVADQASGLLRIIVESLSPFVDFWLAETVSSIEEAQIIAEALAGDVRPLWIAYTLLDGVMARVPSCLRSGQLVEKAVDAALHLNAEAVLFNCSQPEVISPAIEAAGKMVRHRNKTTPIGAYANAFSDKQQDEEANVSLSRIRDDLDPIGYLRFVETWCDQGATIIGGCCGIGPEHIKTLHTAMRKSD